MSVYSNLAAAVFGLLSAYFWFRSAFLPYWRRVWPSFFHKLDPEKQRNLSLLFNPRKFSRRETLRDVVNYNAYAALCAGIASALSAIGLLL
jgi:hypothetical protein